jgi:hypothetical protein
MSRNDVATVKFCASTHPTHDHVGCVLQADHGGRHLGYLPLKPEERPPDLNPDVQPRTEIWWEG